MKNIIKHSIIFLILLFSFVLIFTVDWLYNTFGNLTLEEIVFNIKVPLQGSNTDFYVDYIQNVLPYILVSTLGTFIVLSLIFKQKKYKKRKPKRLKGTRYDVGTNLVVYKRFKLNKRYLAKLTTSFIILSVGISYVVEKTDVVEYAEKQFSDSKLIEDEYVDVTETNLVFPETKRNLIYIYLESMEATYYSKANGGAYEESIIPELEQLALENIAFSSSDTLKGSYTLPGTTWTSGAMVSQSSGLPLKIPIEGNSYGSYDSFLPGVHTIGEVLEKQGYNQMLMVGSDAAFGGRKNFFEQHGNYNIFDFSTAVQEGKRTAQERVWWGFEDNDLFTYAKEKITLLSQDDEPFNFTMLTADTHHPNGYRCADCGNNHSEQYFDVLACSSKKIKEFIEWIQEQDFYENTTIVIAGDHQSMQPGTFDELTNNGYERTTINIFINSAISTINTKNRNCATLDMFPTTLASLGVSIEGDRLGIGTNLFSDKETIISKYGLEYVTEELNKNSQFYKKEFIYDQ